MRLFGAVTFVAAVGLVIPSIVRAEPCSGFFNPPQYTYAGGSAALPEPPTLARADVSMNYAYLTISDPVFNDPRRTKITLRALWQ